MARRLAENTIVVIGLGRFGAELARTLMELDREVLAIDRDPELVAQLAPDVTFPVEADATNPAALRALGVEDVHTAVVAIGSHLESSLLATSALAELEVANIWAKATTPQHEDILKKVGATHVIFPEIEMGRRVAHLLAPGEVREYIDFANGYAISMVVAPQWLWKRTLGQSRLLSNWHVTCFGVQPSGMKKDEFLPATPRTMMNEGDLLVIAGRKQDVDNFTLGRQPRRE